MDKTDTNNKENNIFKKQIILGKFSKFFLVVIFATFPYFLVKKIGPDLDFSMFIYWFLFFGSLTYFFSSTYDKKNRFWFYTFLLFMTILILGTFFFLKEVEIRPPY